MSVVLCAVERSSPD